MQFLWIHHCFVMYKRDITNLDGFQNIFCSAFQHENTLTLATLRIFSNGLGQPHFHFNANEMGYVISGCGQVICYVGEG